MKHFAILTIFIIIFGISAFIFSGGEVHQMTPESNMAAHNNSAGEIDKSACALHCLITGNLMKTEEVTVEFFYLLIAVFIALGYWFIQPIYKLLRDQLVQFQQRYIFDSIILLE